MLREELNELVRSLLPLYMFMAGPVLFIALVGLFFTEWSDGGGDTGRIDVIEEDVRYLEMELDFVRNLYGI